METADLVPLIENLDDNIDDLEEALSTILSSTLSDTAANLPLLEKAHLYVLVTYAIESILFSYLRLHGINAKEHPVFRELIRVKQYFEKLKTAESAGKAPNAKLDKAAAGRFIKHALAGHKTHGKDPAQQQPVRKAAAHIRFEKSSKTPITGDIKTPNSDNSTDEESRSDDSEAVLASRSTVLKGETSLGSDSVDLPMNKSHKRKLQGDNTELIAGPSKSEVNPRKDRKRRKKPRKQENINNTGSVRSG